MSNYHRPFVPDERSLLIPGERALRVLALATVYAAAIFVAVAFSPATGHPPAPQGMRTAALPTAYSPR